MAILKAVFVVLPLTILLFALTMPETLEYLLLS